MRDNRASDPSGDLGERGNQGDQEMRGDNEVPAIGHGICEDQINLSDLNGHGTNLETSRKRSRISRSEIE